MFISAEVTLRLSDVKRTSIKPCLWASGAPVMINSNMSQVNTHCMRQAKLPDSRRDFENRGRRKAGLVLHSASRPLGKTTPHHQREPQEILPTMYKQCSAQHDWTHAHSHGQVGKVRCSYGSCDHVFLPIAFYSHTVLCCQTPVMIFQNRILTPLKIIQHETESLKVIHFIQSLKGEGLCPFTLLLFEEN